MNRYNDRHFRESLPKDYFGEPVIFVERNLSGDGHHFRFIEDLDDTIQHKEYIEKTSDHYIEVKKIIRPWHYGIISRGLQMQINDKSFDPEVGKKELMTSCYEWIDRDKAERKNYLLHHKYERPILAPYSLDINYDYTYHRFKELYVKDGINGVISYRPNKTGNGLIFEFEDKAGFIRYGLVSDNMKRLIKNPELTVKKYDSIIDKALNKADRGPFDVEKYAKDDTLISYYNEFYPIEPNNNIIVKEARCKDNITEELGVSRLNDFDFIDKSYIPNNTLLILMYDHDVSIDSHFNIKTYSYSEFKRLFVKYGNGVDIRYKMAEESYSKSINKELTIYNSYYKVFHYAYLNRNDIQCYGRISPDIQNELRQNPSYIEDHEKDIQFSDFIYVDDGGINKIFVLHHTHETRKYNPNAGK